MLAFPLTDDPFELDLFEPKSRFRETEPSEQRQRALNQARRFDLRTLLQRQDLAKQPRQYGG